jgi:biopolymer transport protein ExbD
MAKRKTKQDLFAGKGLKVDLSPMIDLVFLLLIFFMVAANVITIPIDKKVTIPVASEAKVPKLIQYRVVLNLYQDGSIVDTRGNRLTEEAVTTLMQEARTVNASAQLHLRSDQYVPYKYIKAVTQASARGGVTRVIFSSYQTAN